MTPIQYNTMDCSTVRFSLALCNAVNSGRQICAIFQYDFVSFLDQPLAAAAAAAAAQQTFADDAVFPNWQLFCICR